ncbi:SRPBCC family protein [Nocardia sp. NPDC051321]|uniref:SRPBCC family protein n=1 Tax=Nocardia sp. NPDC051321 TaxID=3364323 RepID=UPI00379174F6
MAHLDCRGIIAVPIDFAFEYGADLRNAAEWVFGVSRVDLASDTPIGVGAVYTGNLTLGPITTRSTVRVTEWVPNSHVCVTSVSAVPSRSTWRFRSLGEHKTEVTVDIDYSLPGGFAGKVLGRTIEPFVQLAVQRSDTALRNTIERRYRQSQSASHPDK